jgi:hypothetical protein
MEEWRYNSTIPDLSFIPWLLYPLGKSTQYPMDKRGGPQSWMLWRREKFCLSQELNNGYPAPRNTN